MRRILSRVALCAVLCAAWARAQPAPGCTQTTVEALQADVGTQMFAHLYGTAKTTLAILAEGEKKPIVQVGNVLSLLDQLRGLGTAYSQSRQVGSLPHWIPGTRVQVCPASEWWKSTLGFKELRIVSEYNIDPRGFGGLLRNYRIGRFDSSVWTGEVEDIGKARSLAQAFSPAGSPVKLGSSLPPDPPPSMQRFDISSLNRLLNATAPPPPTVVRGVVTDVSCNCPVPAATVILTPQDDPQSPIYATADGWGQFAFLRVMQRTYLLSVYAQGYFGRTVQVAANSNQQSDIQVGIERQPPSCTFTIYNNTNWYLDWHLENQQWRQMVPYSNVPLSVQPPQTLYVIARFNGAPPLYWNAIPVTCMSSATLWPPAQ